MPTDDAMQLREAVAVRLGWTQWAWTNNGERTRVWAVPGWDYEKAKQSYGEDQLKRWNFATAEGTEPWYQHTYAEQPPPYESSLSAAEAVLERLTREGWEIGMDWYAKSEVWRVVLSRREEIHATADPRLSIAEATDASLPRAIARAFVQVPERTQ